MGDFIWHPPEGDDTRIGRFMARHGIASVAELHRRSVADIAWFWDAALRDLDVTWQQPYTQVVDDSRGPEWCRWFIDGKLNIAANCLDRHLPERADAPALVWEGEDGAVQRYTYGELAEVVARAAAGLRAHGIAAGDAVGLLMPMVPETAIQMLACFRIGAICVPVFSGYAPAAVAERLRDCGAKLLFTADGGWRRGRFIPLKANADAVAEATPSLERVVVLRRSDEQVPWDDTRDIWWDDFLGEPEGTAAELDSESVALIIYTSGTTGRPKGTVHTHGGTLAQVAKETGYNFDMRPDDVFFWFTDIGWMMGPWLIIGGLHHGATVMLAEGAPNWPDPDRLWKMLARHYVTVLGISPTAIRMLMRLGEAHVAQHDLSALRLLGSTGEPWDEDSYRWFFEHVGGGRCPLINISGGTDIVGCFLAPLPNAPLKPCSLGMPGLGMDVAVWNEAGEPVTGEVGYLVCKQPAPSMTRGLWGDPERYIEAYWSRWPGVWDHGDWALVDGDGQWFILGRADDTLKVAGRRIGPAEIEGALIEHAAVSEAAAIGVPHDLKGEAIVAFVVLQPGHDESDALRAELAEQVAALLGRVDRPEQVFFVDDLPKTRSAKILRRLIRARHLDEEIADLSSVENMAALDAIAEAR